MRRRFFFIPLIGVAIAALVSTAVMLLWNALLPPLVHVGEIGFWQALGLLVLTRLLFGGIHHGWHHNRHHAHMSRHRWLQLSDEERTRLRAHWHHRCGCSPTPEDPTQPA